MSIAPLLFELQQDLPFLSLSLVLCALLVWLANVGLKRLIPFPGRQLATLFVAIHVLLLLIHYIALLTGGVFLPLSLWHFDREWTVASVHSTIQMVLLASLCFLNAIVPAKRRILERLSWMVPGLGFVGFSLLEYQAFDRYLFPETFLLALFGIIVAASSLIIFLRHRKQVVQRFCFFLLPVGLGIFASGYYLDETTILGNSRVEPLEETLELLGIAVALAGAAGYATTNVPRPGIHGRKYLASVCLTFALVFLLLLGAPVWEDTIHKRFGFLWRGIGHEISADLFGGELALRGWSDYGLSLGKQETIRIWLYATRPLASNFGFTFQLLDQESRNTTASVNRRSGIDAHNWTPGILNSVFPWATLRVPEDAPVNRALWLALSFWKIDGEEFTPLTIDFSDHPLLGDTHILLDEVVFPQPAADLQQNEALATIANGFALQRAVLPERVQAGQPMNVEFQWSSISDGEEDWTQFLHFVPEAGASLWNVDQYPLGMRLPTRLWYAGLLSSEHWSFTVPGDLAAGVYKVYTGLYRLADMQRLEVTLADGQQPDDRSIPLGSISIEN